MKKTMGLYRCWWRLLALIAIAASTGCGGGGGGGGAAPVSRFVYAVSYTGQTIAQYRVDTDGTLAALDPANVVTGMHPLSIAVHPSGKYAYVASNDAGVLSYAIGIDGRLGQIGSPVDVSGAPQSVAVHPSGKYAYAANGVSEIAQYTIAIDGTLASMGVVSSMTITPTLITVHPSGKYVYVASRHSGTYSQFAVGADGKLTFLFTSIQFAGLESLAVHPNGSTLYVVDRGKRVLVFDAENGILFGFVGTGPDPFSIAVHPSGKYAYVAYQDGVLQYLLDGAGGITPMTTASVPAGSNPVEVVLDPFSMYAYVANSLSGISQYKIRADGGLDQNGNAAAGSDLISIATSLGYE
jgi:DNA-binding beta-propeller fold protein YncE